MIIGQLFQTHPDSCVHHAPSGSHHSTCTCSFLGCWCTHGRSLRCIRLHIRLHLQRKSAAESEGGFSATFWNTDLAKKHLFSSWGEKKININLMQRLAAKLSVWLRNKSWFKSSLLKMYYSFQDHMNIFFTSAISIIHSDVTLAVLKMLKCK